MKRGQRKLWREVAASAQKVAESKNYAEEYMYGIEFGRAMDALLAAGAKAHAERRRWTVKPVPPE